jgi:hypothetical protein
MRKTAPAAGDSSSPILLIMTSQLPNVGDLVASTAANAA